MISNTKPWPVCDRGVGRALTVPGAAPNPRLSRVLPFLVLLAIRYDNADGAPPGPTKKGRRLRLDVDSDVQLPPRRS